MSVREALTGGILLAALAFSVTTLMADRNSEDRTGGEILSPATAGTITAPADDFDESYPSTTHKVSYTSPCGND